MMRTQLRRSAPPTVERLEHRQLFATVVPSGSNLTITNPVGDLLVETTSTGGQVRVTDDAGSQTYNGVTGTLKITGRGSGAGDVITVAANANDLRAKLVLDSGNGDDTVHLSGGFDKEVEIKTGAGEDSVHFNDDDVEIDRSLKVTDSGGASNSFRMDGRDLEIAEGATISGFDLFEMGADSALIVGDTLSIVCPSGVAANLTFDGAEASFGDELKITTGNLDDTITVTAQFGVGDDMTVNVGRGDNSLTLTPAAGGDGIAETLRYNGEGGVDVVFFGEGTFIRQDAELELGDGTNFFSDSGLTEYGDDLTFVGGGDVNTALINGQVGGMLNVTIGAGSEGSATVITGSIGEKLKYRSGNGGELEFLTLSPAVPDVVEVDIKFGNGESTFVLGPDFSVTGKVQGTGGDYEFVPGAAILLPKLKFVNYP